MLYKELECDYTAIFSTITNNDIVIANERSGCGNPVKHQKYKCNNSYGSPQLSKSSPSWWLQVVCIPLSWWLLRDNTLHYYKICYKFLISYLQFGLLVYNLYLLSLAFCYLYFYKLLLLFLNLSKDLYLANSLKWIYCSIKIFAKDIIIKA